VIAPATGSVSTTRTGWTVGGGFEYLFDRQWTVKAEYIYFDLGSISYGLSPLVSTVGGVPWTTVGVAASTTDFRGSIVRVGLNYKLDYIPVVVK
jgi:outer membrane immunogenic protein